ncbi:glutamine amidotransferase [Paludibacterium sp. B53371]|uniref:glutamine amidotransferase n=1 Tax=Paludibacterium sp. B53371 TaxID=2806263 RepID=UPI001C0539BE|nr:glutamine amidotransferase [Paludibacterium sp. B53371]
MSKTAWLIQHVAFEDAGLWTPLLHQVGYRIEKREAGTDLLPAVLPGEEDLLIVLGGPISASQVTRYPFLSAELDLIRTQLTARRPVLGVCLGAQLMACALGARVSPMARQEIGYAPLMLTEAGRDSVLAPLDHLPVLHWHGEQFAIPDSAQHLAYSEQCPFQAFAIERHALALQCHLEVDPNKLERWLIGHTAELAHAGIAPETLRQQAQRLGQAVVPQSRKVFQQWLEQWEATR